MNVASERALLQVPEPHEIGSLARRGGLWTVGLILSRTAISMGTTAILARRLSPTDYGLMGMVVTLTAFFQIFSDMGLSWVTVQRREITRAELDNLFWVNLAGGALLWGACAAAGPILSRFYVRSELRGIAGVLGAGFLLSSLAVQPAALLRRRMRLKELGLAQTAAHVTGAFIGVVLAILHAGYWALVGQSLALQASLLLVLYVQTGYQPRLPRRAPGTRSLLALGGFLVAFALTDYIVRTINNILLGRVWGAEALGYYSRAYFLMLLPMYLTTGGLSGVMVPALSALKDDLRRLETAYRKATLSACLVSFPLAVGLAVTAREAIRVVYGPQWGPVSPILAWLAVGAISQPIYGTTGWLFTAAGKGRALLWFGMMTAAAVTVAVLIGVRGGAVGLAAAMGLTLTFAVALPALFYSHRVVGLCFSKTVLPLLPMLFASLAMGAIAGWVGREFAALGWPAPAVLATQVMAGLVTYPFLVLIFRGHTHPLRELRAGFGGCCELGMGGALEGVYRLAGVA